MRDAHCAVSSTARAGPGGRGCLGLLSPTGVRALEASFSCVGPCHVQLCHVPFSWGSSVSSQPGELGLRLGLELGSDLVVLCRCGPMHTLWALQPHDSNTAGLRPHCCFFQSRCPHRLFFPIKSGCYREQVKGGGGGAGSIPQALWVLSGNSCAQDICPNHSLSSTFFLACLCWGQARPHISRSWMQNSSRCERVSLSKVSQGWLPPWCRSPSSHSPNLPLRMCQEHGQLRPASSMAGDLPRHLLGHHQPPPVFTLSSPKWV